MPFPVHIEPSATTIRLNFQSTAPNRRTTLPSWSISISSRTRTSLDIEKFEYSLRFLTDNWIITDTSWSRRNSPHYSIWFRFLPIFAVSLPFNFLHSERLPTRAFSHPSGITNVIRHRSKRPSQSQIFAKFTRTLRHIPELGEHVEGLRARLCLSGDSRSLSA
jgi:hypothetical protein